MMLSLKEMIFAAQSAISEEDGIVRVDGDEQAIVSEGGDGMLSDRRDNAHDVVARDRHLQRNATLTEEAHHTFGLRRLNPVANAPGVQVFHCVPYRFWVAFFSLMN